MLIEYPATGDLRTAEDKPDDLERELNQEPQDLEREQQNELHFTFPFVPSLVFTRKKTRAQSSSVFGGVLLTFK